MNLLRRHPITLALIALVLVSAPDPLPPLVDAVSGAAVLDADLVRPAAYTALAPLSNTLDMLTFLSLERARWLLIAWVAGLALWGGLVRRGPWWRRLIRAVLGPLGVVLLGLAAALLPRPVPQLVPTDSAVTVIDYHAHTAASHDGRRGWTMEDLAAWHAVQGFGASYVTDHNVVFSGRGDDPFRLLPGVEWSVYQQHIIALGAVQPIDRAPYERDTPGMLALFGELHRQGAIGIASLPEYWRNHWDDLDDFVKAGADGFEIVNCAPQAIGFPAAARTRVLGLAAAHDLLVVGASDNHGWGKVTCVWNLSNPSAHGYRANRVIARPIALAQGDWEPWTAPYTQPWLMLRSLSWSERSSWITWIVVILIYRSVPRRAGDAGGLGILARSLSLKILKLPRPTAATGEGK
ncbi:MAG TPA: hypothetical protein VEU55_09255 [Gemmatimonadales bacterium]|nr:hypothetical protein [Gemmatimonadales bacterium]